MDAHAAVKTATRFAVELQIRHYSSNSPSRVLDLCGKHNITADIELIPIQKINEAYDRLENGDNPR